MATHGDGDWALSERGEFDELGGGERFELAVDVVDDTGVGTSVTSARVAAACVASDRLPAFTLDSEAALSVVAVAADGAVTRGVDGAESVVPPVDSLVQTFNERM